MNKGKRDIRMKKLFFILLIFFIALPILGVANTKVAKYKITDEEQLVVDKFKDETITLGYTTGYSEVITEHVLQIMKSDLMLDIESVEYPNYHSLYTAVNTGEIDIASTISEKKSDEGLYFSKSFFRDYRIIVTTIDSSITDISDLAYLKVGFLADDVNYELTESTIEKFSMEPVFYQTFQEASEALSTGEIKAYIGSSMERDSVAMDPKLIAKTSLLDNPAGIKFATKNEDMQPLIETIANVVGDLSDKVRGEALQKKLDKYEDELIKGYLHSQYANFEDYDKVMNVGTAKKSYPYAYLEKEDNLKGKYIDFLNYFEEKTGIEYTIANQDNTNLTYGSIVEQLNSNDIQLILGAFNYDDFSNIQSLPALESVDYLISVQSDNFKGHEFSSIDNMKVGLTRDNIDFATKESYENVELYDTSSELIDGLLNDEVDILLTKQSVYDYYQRVEFFNKLHQNSTVYKEYPFEILVNKQNQDLNSMIEEMYSIYTTFIVGESTYSPKVITSEFINSYLEISKTKNSFMYVIIIFAIILVLLIGIAVILVQDQRKKEVAAILHKHQVDDLTGIWNRYIYKEKCLELMDRYANELGVFIYLDLNYFKQVNDTYGHHNGDLVLIEFAKGLKSFESDTVIPFRIAGDEFGLYAAGFESEDEIKVFINKVASYPFKEIELQDTDAKVTIKYSLGFAIYLVDSTDLEALHVYADTAMYKAKEFKDRNEFNCQVARYGKSKKD